MIHYPHIIMACADELWAIQYEKLEAITSFLVLKARGGEVSAEELARITAKTEHATAQSDGEVAILPVYGTLAQRMNMMMEFSGGTSMQKLAAAFRDALGDSNVKAIIFDHNSPGGTYPGTGELAQEILDSRGVKPMVAQVNSLAASASYWLAAAADEIVVTPGGSAGSIGVYRVHEDVQKMAENAGVKPTIIRADGSPYKIEDSGLEPLSAEALEHAKSLVNDSYDRMTRSIAQARNTTLANVRENYGKGRIYQAPELVKRGMAERIATLPETLERFGGGIVNPHASAARMASVQRAEAANILVTKLKAGDQPTAREWEHGLKGLAGLSNSEAERAVRHCFKTAQGDPEDPTELPKANIAPIKQLMAGISINVFIGGSNA